MPEIAVGLAREEHYDELIALLDNVFFLEDEEEPKRGFISLLPKLYKREHRPWENNHCVWEDGVLKAAVGLYVSDISIAGEPLRVGGIGNVAVARDCRRKGYMKLAMDAAMEAMKAEGCHLGELGGQRQRYQFWGFERGGAAVSALFSEKNLRHAFGESAFGPQCYAREIKPADSKAIEQVRVLIESSPLHYKHSPDAFYDHLCSWNETPFIIMNGEAPAGFFTYSRNKKCICQFVLRDAETLAPALRTAYAVLPESRSEKEADISIPLWQKEMLCLAEELSERCRLEDTGMYTILKWEKVLSALMKLQALCKPLPDGQLCVRIQGWAGEECLCICVQGGKPSVSACTCEPEKTFTHLQALRFFLAPFSTLRKDDTLAQCWFPLPIYLMGIDTV